MYWLSNKLQLVETDFLWGSCHTRTARRADISARISAARSASIALLSSKAFLPPDPIRPNLNTARRWLSNARNYKALDSFVGGDRCPVMDLNSKWTLIIIIQLVSCAPIMIPVSRILMGFITIGIVYITVAYKGWISCDGTASYWRRI